VEPNIHWLAPPSWSQWSVQYPLAGITKLVAMEIKIFTGWHHHLGRSGEKFLFYFIMIHWLAPSSWSQRSSEYSLAGITNWLQ
jgi:hypothetical protein